MIFKNYMMNLLYFIFNVRQNFNICYMHKFGIVINVKESHVTIDIKNKINVRTSFNTIFFNYTFFLGYDASCSVYFLGVFLGLR